MFLCIVTKEVNMEITKTPDRLGYYGEYGGTYLPDNLKTIMGEIAKAYASLRNDPSFTRELQQLLTHYVGRPSPVYHAKNLSRALGGAAIYLKREDLNHTGAHKINHCLGEALLAKKMGKSKLIAETGAGQHGVALATAAALTGLKCTIYMGEIDVMKEHPNVSRMKILGAGVITVTRGTRSLKDAVDAAMEAYLDDPVNSFYAIGSVVGPHPFPMMVSDFQKVVGKEARRQILDLHNSLPDAAVACVGGGSNAMGLFSGFLDDKQVILYGVEPAGKSFKPGEHAATLTKGSPGILHGFKSYLLQDENGDPQPVYSIASGLDYPGVGPQHSYLKDINRVHYVSITDEEAVDAFFTLSRMEGIIPAVESAHAVAYGMKLAQKMNTGSAILINLSGRGDKDVDFILDQYGDKYVR